MAHKKSGGSKARQGSKPAGKRLGIKIYSGEQIAPGQIIMKQNGTVVHPGVGVQKGRDFTLFATKKGAVSFRKHQGRKFVDVT